MMRIKNEFFLKGSRLFGLLSITSVLFLTFPSYAVSDNEAAESVSDFLNLDLAAISNFTIKTASKVEEPILKTIATTHVITSADIQGHNCRDFIDVLNLLPNVTAGKNYLGRTSITLRGTYEEDSSKILFLWNGHVMNNARNGSGFANFQDNLSLSNIDRIEFVKGTGSSLYGANAFLAVVNIVSYAPSALKGTQVEGQVEWNERGLYHRRLGLTRSINEHHAFNISLNTYETDAIEMKQTNILGNTSGQARVNSQLDSLDAQWLYQQDEWNVRTRININQAGDFYGAQGHPFDDSKQQNQSIWLHGDYQIFDTEKYQVNLNLYFDYLHMRPQLRQSPAGIPRAFPGLDAGFPAGIQYVIGSKEIHNGFKLFGNVKLSEQHQIQTGIEYRYETLFDPETKATFKTNPLGGFLQAFDQLNSSQTDFLPEVDRHISSIFVQDLWELNEKTRINLGGRFDRFSDFGNSFSPKAGFNYEISPSLSMRGSIGSAFRAPDFFMLYLANNPLQRGNKDLQPEKTLTSELGLEWVDSNLSMSATFFQNDFEDLIQLTKHPVLGDRGVSQFENIDSATIRGLEFSLKYKLLSNLNWGLGYARNALVKSSRTPDFMPEEIVRLSVSKAITPDVTLGADGFYVSGSQSSNTLYKPLPEQYRLDINFQYKLKGTSFLSLSIKNLFDSESYQPVTGVLAPQLGRTVLAKLSWDFN